MAERHIHCDMSCEVPDGMDLREVPRPRHAWADVLRCPNDGCGKAFLVEREAAGNSTA